VGAAAVTTTRIAWRFSDRFDIHLLRGKKRRLDGLLLLHQADGTQPTGRDRPLPGDVASLTFVPRIKGAVVGGVITARGVKVDTATGEVEAVSPAPAPPLLSNLVVEARCQVNDAAAPGGVRNLVATMRIHVHTSVTRAWCTPTPLSIHKGADGQRLSVLAQFDDNTVGDITQHPGFAWASAIPGKVAVAATGELSAPGATGGPAVQVTATLSAELGGSAATGQVRVLDAWSAQPAAVRKATLVAGPGPEPAVMAQVPNVLFVAEGFPDTDADRFAFEQCAAEAVRQLRTSKATSPFNLIKDRVNYWRVFLPSNQSGESTLYELDLVNRGASIVGQEMPRPVAPNPLTALPPIGPLPPALEYRLENLVHLVGLPVPADAAVDLATKGGQWTAMFNDVDLRRVTLGLYDRWRDLNDRRVANERDTALGLAQGERPAYDLFFPERAIGPFFAMRTTREHLDQFLRTITRAGPAVIGATWDQHPSAPTPPGKDQDLVIALAFGARDSGAMTQTNDRRHTQLVAVGLVSTSETRLKAVAGRREVDVLPNPLPRKGGTVVVVREVLARIAHETAHIARVGDEYGGKGGMPDDELDRLRGFANLQPRDDLLAVPFAGLRGGQVKWRWPRLLRAGRLKLALVDETGGVFRAELDPGHGASFAAPDLVRLRQPLPDGGVAVPKLSDELRVLSVAADKVRVQDLHGTVVVGDFPAGSVLCDPVPARASAVLAGDIFAELLDQVIRVHIDATGGPLNARPPLRDCVNDPVNGLQLATNLPAGLPFGRPRFRSWIVGLYEGGMEYDCRPYHPTGACIMRVLQVPAANPFTHTLTSNPGAIYRFCHVCQYVIVDRLDASRHADLEALFSGQDAQP